MKTRAKGGPEPAVVIGWNEYVDIPAWGIERLRAKADTGARSSALHVENIQELPRARVRFEVVLHRRKRDRRVTVTAPIARRGRVRSSTGHYETRIFVEAPVRIGPVERDVEVSLVDRERMIFRMLLGRTALAGAFLIDPERKQVLHSSRPERARAARSRVGRSTRRSAKTGKAGKSEKRGKAARVRKTARTTPDPSEG